MSSPTSSGAILVFNAGSSSLKFSIFHAADAGELDLRARGQMDQFGTTPHLMVRDAGGHPLAEERFAPEHVGDTGQAVRIACEWLAAHLAEEDVTAVGHRVVHGGAEFSQPVLVKDDILARLEALIPLAPLHQPYNVAAIRAATAWRPGLPQVACFDTAFHRTHSPLADRYALPARFYASGIRRYGFHGISYAYIASALPRVAPAIAGGKVIVAHLGNGASLCALEAGRSVDSTMGFSTLDGLCMGTRAGSLDPGVLLHLLSHRGMPLPEVERLLYHASGLRGLSGFSGDMRQLLASDAPEARLALDYFVWRITKEIGALAAVLSGLDGMVFTAGIGENQPAIRASIVQACGWLGCALDAEANAKHGPRITTAASKASAWVIPTHEEEMIAREVLRVLSATAQP
jgi:acetate kinase